MLPKVWNLISHKNGCALLVYDFFKPKSWIWAGKLGLLEWCTPTLGNLSRATTLLSGKETSWSRKIYGKRAINDHCLSESLLKPSWRKPPGIILSDSSKQLKGNGLLDFSSLTREYWGKLISIFLILLRSLLETAENVPYSSTSYTKPLLIPPDGLTALGLSLHNQGVDSIFLKWIGKCKSYQWSKGQMEALATCVPSLD